MIRYRGWFFLFALAIFLVAWPVSQRLLLDRSLERMFPPADLDRQAFELLESRFGVSRFLVFAYRDGDLWEESGKGIERAAELRKRLEAVDGVRYALDVSRIDEMLASIRGPSFLNAASARRPLVDPQYSLAIRYRDLFEGQTHARDSDLVALGILLDTEMDANQVSKTLADLRDIGKTVRDGMLVGHLAMVEEGFREIEKDGDRLAIYSTISLTLLMLIGFRSIRWALIAIAVVQWSLVVTRALLVLLDWELTMVSSMLSSIVMVVGVATTMHWMFGYHREFDARREITNPFERAREAACASIAQLWWPILWACVTDAIGFGSLVFSRVGPVQDYGSMMAIACSVVLVGIFALVPTLLLLGPRQVDPHARFAWYRLGELPGEQGMQHWLQHLLAWVLKRRTWVLCIVAALTLFASIGSMRLRVETDFLKNFHAQSPISAAYRAVETELGGAGIWDVMIPAPAVITPEYFARVEELTNELKTIEIPGQPPLRLTSAMGLADTDRIAQDSPVLKMLPVEARLFGMRQTMGTFFDTLLVQDGDKRYLRIMLRARERSDSQQKLALIDAVQKCVRQHVSSDAWLSMLHKGDAGASPAEASSDNNHEERFAAGYFILLTRLVEHVVADQWIAFIMATLGIGLAMIIALRNVRLALVGLVPAILPNLVVLGCLGWSGTPVNLGAAMIAAVSMGLGVDSSLHYLVRYQSARKSGRSTVESLQIAQGDTGLAVVMATLALVLGFGSMALSNFLPTVAFGTLAAWTMFGGLIGNLCVLPALVAVVERD